jgi:hypothetical protein
VIRAARSERCSKTDSGEATRDELFATRIRAGPGR